jgi:glycosyltransferase involved in cell wall biosynthesis
MDPTHPDYSNTPASDARSYGAFAPEDPDTPPAVTILTPFFNTGAVFHETATSIFRQTFQQWEWLIVDDCSTDPQAIHILEAYERHPDPRIKVVRSERNAGPSAARNRGMAMARAAFVYHIDSDDLIEPTTLEKCFWYLVSHPECPWVNGWSVGFGAAEYLWQFGYHNGAQFLTKNMVTGRTMIRTAVHHQLGGYDETVRAGYEDWVFWLKGAETGIWGHTIPEYFDWYRRRKKHWSRWQSIADEDATAAFTAALPKQFPQIFSGEFPRYQPRWPLPFESFADTLPATNHLRKTGRRLLMVLPWLAMGGADKFNLDVVEQLTARGWQVTILTTRPNDHAWHGVFQQLTPDIFHIENVVHPSQQALFLRYLIASRQPDCVLISGSELGYWLLPYLRHHLPTVPFIDYCHIDEPYWKNGGYPRYSAASQAQLDLAVVSSTYLRDWMVQQHGADPARIRVVTTNIDPALWRPDAATRKRVRKAQDVAADTPVILFAGRICQQKQPETLAMVLRELHASGAAFQTWIAGDGDDRPWLEQFVEQHQLDTCVKLLGAQPTATVRELMQAADIFFLPSLWEGIALSIYESMACGLTVVGATVGGQRELVTPDCGILIDRPNNDQREEINRYVSALKSLLADPAQCRAMGSAARQRIVDHFPLNAMAGNLIAAIDAAADRRHVSFQQQPAPSCPLLARETAVRAIEYFRVEAIADSLWREAQANHNPEHTPPPAPNLQTNPLKDWNHIQRHLPFRAHQWLHQGCCSKALLACRLIQYHDCYNESLTIEERLLALLQTPFYQRVMRLKKFSFLRPLLPKAPRIQKKLISR